MRKLTNIAWYTLYFFQNVLQTAYDGSEPTHLLSVSTDNEIIIRRLEYIKTDPLAEEIEKVRLLTKVLGLSVP